MDHKSFVLPDLPGRVPVRVLSLLRCQKLDQKVEFRKQKNEAYLRKCTNPFEEKTELCCLVPLCTLA